MVVEDGLRQVQQVLKAPCWSVGLMAFEGVLESWPVLLPVGEPPCTGRGPLPDAESVGPLDLDFPGSTL